jgi:hypothetical protein
MLLLAAAVSIIIHPRAGNLSGRSGISSKPCDLTVKHWLRPSVFSSSEQQFSKQFVESNYQAGHVSILANASKVLQK